MLLKKNMYNYIDIKLQEGIVNKLFFICVNVLYWICNKLHLDYNFVNIILFCIILPIITISSIILNIYLLFV